MIDQEGYVARGSTPASNLREELRAAGEERVSKPLSRTAPDIPRWRPATEASYEPPPLKKELMCLFLRELFTMVRQRTLYGAPHAFRRGYIVCRPRYD